MIKFTALLLAALLAPICVSAQCMLAEISLEKRIDEASYIVVGSLMQKHSYWNAEHTNIFTAQIISVHAYLKGHSSNQELIVITEGGIVNDEMQITQPSVQLDKDHSFVIMLDKNELVDDNKMARILYPTHVQAKTYACNQGLFLFENGVYHDHISQATYDESLFFTKIKSRTGLEILTPDGKKYNSKNHSTTHSSAKIQAISSFSPATTVAGTIVPGDFITITGAGFGAVAGTVFFTNADDGGATLTSSGIASDVTSWADGAITVKVAARAGTGPINVNGVMTSASNLTITYAHTNINSTTSGFGSSTRQRFYHRNMNGTGGMSFLYNTTSGFSANTAAIASFERAMETWRCATFINWYSNGTTTNSFALDGVNSVEFNAGLGAGVLGRATSRFSGASVVGCTLANTVWCVSEIDVQFAPDPPSVGFPWQYGPALPTFSNYDFESVALHELGHGHGLGHVINPGKVMHYALTNGATARTLDAAVDIAAGTARMAYSSVASCFNPATCGTGPMTLLTAGTCAALPLDIFDFTGHAENQNTIHLEWISSTESPTSFTLYKSLDGIHFVPIQSFSPQTTLQVSSFEFIDPSASFSAYYKLERTNDEGTTYKTIFVSMAQSIPIVFSADGQIKIDGIIDSNSDSNFILYSAQGAILQTKNFTGSSYTLDEPEASGIYLYSLSENGKLHRGKILVK